jgi:hypothetical protein
MRRYVVNPSYPRVMNSPSTYAAWIEPGGGGRPMTLLSRTSRFGFRWWIAGDRPSGVLPGRGAGIVILRRRGRCRRFADRSRAWSRVAIARASDQVALYLDGRRVGTASLEGFVPPGRRAGCRTHASAGRRRGRRNAVRLTHRRDHDVPAPARRR